MSLSENQISGPLPVNLANLTNISRIIISHFSFEAPHCFLPELLTCASLRPAWTTRLGASSGRCIRLPAKVKFFAWLFFNDRLSTNETCYTRIILRRMKIAAQDAPTSLRMRSTSSATAAHETRSRLGIVLTQQFINEPWSACSPLFRLQHNFGLMSCWWCSGDCGTDGMTRFSTTGT